MNYQLHLKGFVGGYDFDADYVDYVLNKNQGSEVHVLIDSLGGRSDTALSIYAAFKRHANVHVHFVGMNASAATIASLGAKRITMDRSAMYLVHKCSISFFEWAQLNADELQSLIDNIEKDKENLDKLDANVAEMYASKCKKTPAEMLSLMAKGGWLSSTEALEWGFVDEITEFESDQAPALDNATKMAMAAAGIPIPDSMKEARGWRKFMAALQELFSSNVQDHTITHNMNKKFNYIGAILQCESLPVNDGQIALKEEQFDALEANMKQDKELIQALQTRQNSLESEITTLKAEIDALKKKPAETSQQVVNDKKEESQPSDIESFVTSYNSAKEIFNMFD